MILTMYWFWLFHYFISGCIVNCLINLGLKVLLVTTLLLLAMPLFSPKVFCFPYNNYHIFLLWTLHQMLLFGLKFIDACIAILQVLLWDHLTHLDAVIQWNACQCMGGLKFDHDWDNATIMVQIHSYVYGIWKKFIRASTGSFVLHI